jgi:alpha-galactosidase
MNVLQLLVKKRFNTPSPLVCALVLGLFPFASAVHADPAPLQMPDGRKNIGDQPAGPPSPATPDNDPGILTPPPPATPRINGPKIFGVRPQSPFLYTIPATGNRPMTFSADNLPSGLSLDANTGQITGKLASTGTYTVTFHAQNAAGKADKPFTIFVGDNIALTPAMGWNSWNCWASAVDANKVLGSAQTLIDSGLSEHGWSYVNIDDYWQVNPGSKDPTLHGPVRDAAGNIVPNPRFPDMKGLVDKIHGMGLKTGVYSSPGRWTCGGCAGSYEHEAQDAQQYAAWGFDYLKYDWCSYGQVYDKEIGGGGLPGRIKPYKLMADALAKTDRDILFSYCQYGYGDVWKWAAQNGGNSWRTTGDITDTWASMMRNAMPTADLAEYASPGHFNDPDMLIVGIVGWGHPHPTHLTHQEQYTHVSLWCLLTSPLLIGCDMSKLDPFTLNLLTNDEVLAVDQDSLGKQATRVVNNGPLQVFAKPLDDGSLAVGLFNFGPSTQDVAVSWSDLHITGKQVVRDLWRQKDIGVMDDKLSAPIPSHGVLFVRIHPAQ